MTVTGTAGSGAPDLHLSNPRSVVNDGTVTVSGTTGNGCYVYFNGGGTLTTNGTRNLTNGADLTATAADA